MKLSAAVLGRQLRRQVPAEIAEVVLPTVTWRIGRRQVTAVLPNPVWADCFSRYIEETAAALIQEADMRLAVRTAQDAETGVLAKITGFETFLRDPGNDFALLASRRVVESPGLEHNPLYLHGPAGCGKTHLLQAIAAEYRSMLGDDSIVILPGDEFVSRIAHQLAERRQQGLRNRIAGAALVAVDGIDPLAGRSLAQEELFHLINAGLDAGQQVVVTGLLPPQRLKGLEVRLSTRLSWGLTVAIEAPHLETRLAFLRQRCGSALEELDAAVLPDLLDAQAPNMHAVAEFADRILRGEDPTRLMSDISFDRILSCVAEQVGLRPGDIIGKRRSRDIAQARQTALLLARRLTSHKLESLGALVGGRDHSTVIYSLRQAEERLDKEPDYAEVIRGLTQRILDNR